MKNDLVRIFTGSMIDVQYYSERLEESSIASMWKDEFGVRTQVGMGGIPNTVNLFVSGEDADRALEIIEKLQQTS